MCSRRWEAPVWIWHVDVICRDDQVDPGILRSLLRNDHVIVFPRRVIEVQDGRVAEVNPKWDITYRPTCESVGGQRTPGARLGNLDPDLKQVLDFYAVSINHQG